jgi:hypothetical protein
MSSIFDEDVMPAGGHEEEDFVDEQPEVLEEGFNLNTDIRLDYGTETVFVNVTEEPYAGKTLSQIAAMKANELGFSRDPNTLNYKKNGNYIDGTTVPNPAEHYTASAARDTKG